MIPTAPVGLLGSSPTRGVLYFLSFFSVPGLEYFWCVTTSFKASSVFATKSKIEDEYPKRRL